MDWLDLLAVQGTLKGLLQHHSSKASILLQHSAFFTVQLSHPYMTTGKTIALTRQIFVGKVMSLLFNMLSRLVITSIFYIENPKGTIRKLLELISEFSKVVVYKINTWKLLAFLYTNNEKSEREIKESILFTITTKRIKYLGINLPKEMKELYTENYKMLMKNQR
jgi:small-conductance mechanosensitive channel